MGNIQALSLRTMQTDAETVVLFGLGVQRKRNAQEQTRAHLRFEQYLHRQLSCVAPLNLPSRQLVLSLDNFLPILTSGAGIVRKLP